MVKGACTQDYLITRYLIDAIRSAENVFNMSNFVFDFSRRPKQVRRICDHKQMNYALVVQLATFFRQSVPSDAIFAQRYNVLLYENCAFNPFHLHKNVGHSINIVLREVSVNSWRAEFKLYSIEENGLVYLLYH